MANVIVKSKIVLRNDTHENWSKANPILLKGEPGYCSDKQYLKIGDGTSNWNLMPGLSLGKVIFTNRIPTEDDAQESIPGTLAINITTSPPEIYLLAWQNPEGNIWQQLITHEGLISMGAMLEANFANSSGAGAVTGYVDKALTADKLTNARTIILSGGVNGRATFDGHENIIITTNLSIQENDIPSLPLSKIRDAGTAAAHNVGTAAGQVPMLDPSGKLNTSVLPQLSIVDVVEAASDAEMLSKVVQKGDICLRSDAPAGAFILAGDDPKVLANWKRIPVPANAVLSVNGKVGVITLTTDDIAEGSRLYFTTARIASYLQDAANTFIMDGGKA